MSILESIQWGILVGLPLGGMVYGHRQALWRTKTETELATLRKQFARFTSPEVISQDMEQVADLIETRQAERQAMPRPGTQPHARISKVSSDKATGWLKRR